MSNVRLIISALKDEAFDHDPNGLLSRAAEELEAFLDGEAPTNHEKALLKLLESTKLEGAHLEPAIHPGSKRLTLVFGEVGFDHKPERLLHHLLNLRGDPDA